jgi:hypothetical protein
MILFAFSLAFFLRAFCTIFLALSLACDTISDADALAALGLGVLGLGVECAFVLGANGVERRGVLNFLSSSVTAAVALAFFILLLALILELMF